MPETERLNSANHVQPGYIDKLEAVADAARKLLEAKGVDKINAHVHLEEALGILRAGIDKIPSQDSVPQNR